MSWQLGDTITNTIWGMLDSAARGTSEAPNPASTSAAKMLSPLRAQLCVGTITRSGAGLYDATVNVPGFNPRMTCIQLSTAVAELTGYGVNHSQLIPEGSTVFVWRPESVNGFGIILCAAPPFLTPNNTGNDSKPETRHIQMLDCEPGVADFTEKAYSQGYEKNAMSIMANGGRPIDLLPGDISWINELGIGMAIRKLVATMFASDHCKMELFLLDDLMRIVAGQFQHFSAIGEQQIYNSNGNVTLEMSGSSHQCEVTGYDKYDTEFVKDIEWDREHARQADKQLDQADQMLKRRYQLYLGHLGGLFNFFVSKPEVTSGKANTYKATSKDEGLAHIGVGEDGTIMLRSAGDIVIQRNDHIPVPKKLKEPWDPSGDGYKAESQKAPYTWGDTDVRSHPTQSRDAIAWYVKMMYQPLIDNSDLSGKKDFHLINESTQPIPANKYDELIGHLSDYNDELNKSKRSEIVLRKDGGITMRDNAGAEISLINGRVIISAPEGIEIRSGQTALVTAVKDVIVKGRDNVDITATKQDVRIKAESNMQVMAKGILLESSATYDNQDFGSKGSDVRSTGIIMRAEKSRIFMWGKIIHLAVIDDLLLEALGTVGKIAMACKTMIMTAAESLYACCSETTALVLNKSSGILHAKTAGCQGQDSAYLIKGNTYALPQRWANLATNPFNQLTEQIKPKYNEYQVQVTWLGDYTSENRDKYKFSYRTESQYGTEGSTFRMYESLWAYMARKTGTDLSWDETVVNDTTPWPGKSYYSGGKSYYQLESEVNITSSRTGEGMDWLKRKANGSGFTGVGFDKYQG